MALPHLKESLCGCTLKTGTKIIGWFSVSLSSITLLLLLVVVCLDMALLKHVVQIDDANQKQDAAVILTVSAILLFFIAFFVLLYIVFAVLLLVGVYHDRAGFIQAWIIFAMITTFIDFLGLLGSLGQKSNIMQVLGLCLNIYCILIVNSHHTNVKQRKYSASAPPSYAA